MPEIAFVYGWKLSVIEFIKYLINNGYINGSDIVKYGINSTYILKELGITVEEWQVSFDKWHAYLEQQLKEIVQNILERISFYLIYDQYNDISPDDYTHEYFDFDTSRYPEMLKEISTTLDEDVRVFLANNKDLNKDIIKNYIETLTIAVPGLNDDNYDECVYNIINHIIDNDETAGKDDMSDQSEWFNNTWWDDTCVQYDMIHDREHVIIGRAMFTNSLKYITDIPSIDDLQHKLPKVFKHLDPKQRKIYMLSDLKELQA